MATEVPGQINPLNGNDGSLPEDTSRPGPPSKDKGFFINRNFTLLTVGQAISNMGDFIYSTTVLIWVFVLTHSAGAVSGVLIAQYAPVFLFGPIAGVFVDRWNRRTTMIVSDVARTVVALLPLIVPLFLRLPAIYTSVFLISSFSRFFMPAKAGILQVIVPEKEQPQAASFSQAAFALSFIIGPALASPLYFAVGPIVACMINAASFLVSAFYLRAMLVPQEALRPHPVRAKPGPQGVKQAERSTGAFRAVMQELFAGYKLVVKTRVLLTVAILALIGMLGVGALNALEIIFVSSRLHVSAALYGPLTAAGGVGTLLGAICAGIVARRMRPKYILAGSVLLLGLGLIIYSFQTEYLIALAIIFVIGIPQGGIDVGFTPLLLNNTPQNMIGRVQSVLETSMFGMSLISIGLSGYFGQFVPVNVIFAICGALIALAGLFGWFAIPETQKTEGAAL